MNNCSTLIKGFVTLWRANTTLTSIPLWPVGNVRANPNDVSYATIECKTDVKKRNSGKKYLQDYTVFIKVFSTAKINDVHNIIEEMINTFDFTDYAFPEVSGGVLWVIDLPEEPDIDKDEQQTQVVREVKRSWSIRVCQTRN